MLIQLDLDFNCIQHQLAQKFLVTCQCHNKQNLREQLVFLTVSNLIWSEKYAFHMAFV